MSISAPIFLDVLKNSDSRPSIPALKTEKMPEIHLRFNNSVVGTKNGERP